MKNPVHQIITLAIILLIFLIIQENLGISIAQCALEDYTDAQIRDYVLKYYMGPITKVHPMLHIGCDHETLERVISSYNEWQEIKFKQHFVSENLFEGRIKPNPLTWQNIFGALFFAFGILCLMHAYLG